MATKTITHEENQTSDHEQAVNATAVMHNRADIQQAIRDEIDRPDLSSNNRFTKYELAHIAHMIGADL